MNKRPFNLVSIGDHDEYREAGIDLLASAEALLKRTKTELTVLPRSRGLARVINLLAWDVDAHHEFLDGEQLVGDQVIHLALHQAVAALPHMDSGQGMLVGEVIASSVDLYLVGCFIQAGLEPDFLHDSLESYGFYYDAYARDPGQFEGLLIQLQSAPYQTMMSVATYLYEFCERLARPTTEEGLEALHTLETHIYYPLIHHFNVTNWLLAIRQRFGIQWETKQAAGRLLGALALGPERLMALLDDAALVD